MVKIRKSTFFIILLLLLQITSFLTSNIYLSEASESNENNSMIFPSDLNIGDLLFCDIKPDILSIADTYGLSQIKPLPGYANDHVAMYIGNNNFIEAAPYLFAPLRNEWIGVVITPYWLLKIWATNITFGYVKTEQKTRDGAVKWAKTQIGNSYGEKGYTCAELVFEAYKKQNLILNFTWPYSNRTFNASIPGMIIRSDQVVMYSNFLPTADISDPLGYNYVNDTVYLSAFNSSDLDGMIIKFIWDFGDGTYVEKHPSIGRQVTHVYKKPGEYTIKLTVIDNAGATDVDTTTILIKENDFFDDDGENDTDKSNQDTPDNSKNENNTQEIIEEDIDVGLSIFIALFSSIFLSIIVLIWVIKK